MPDRTPHPICPAFSPDTRPSHPDNCSCHPASCSVPSSPFSASIRSHLLKRKIPSCYNLPNSLPRLTQHALALLSAPPCQLVLPHIARHVPAALAFTLVGDLHLPQDPCTGCSHCLEYTLPPESHISQGQLKCPFSESHLYGPKGGPATPQSSRRHVFCSQLLPSKLIAPRLLPLTSPSTCTPVMQNCVCLLFLALGFDFFDFSSPGSPTEQGPGAQP